MNCAALPDSLLESEAIRSHARRVYRGARIARRAPPTRARGHPLPRRGRRLTDAGAGQPFCGRCKRRSYRRLGDSAVKRSNFRLVSASHKDLDAEVAAGRFRLDLLFRLRVVQDGTATTSRSANGYYRLGEALLEREQPEAGPTSAPALPWRGERSSGVLMAGERPRARKRDCAGPSVQTKLCR